MTNINTICLCGSTRFLDDFQRANIEFTARGLSVITISMALPRQPDGTHKESMLKHTLDLVHMNKILRSDAIFIVGDGYIGLSTAREILWANMQNKAMLAQWTYNDDAWDRIVDEIRYGSDARDYLIAEANAALTRLISNVSGVL